MLLGIFDVFHINEFNGKITNWVEVFVTMIGTGVVTGFIAYKAAKWQIDNQKELRDKLQAEENEQERIFLKYLIESTINEFNKNTRMISRSTVCIDITQKNKSVVYYAINCRFPLKFKKFNSSRMFHLLLPGKKEDNHIKLFTEFLEALDIGGEVLALLKETQYQHKNEQKIFSEEVNSLFQEFLINIGSEKIKHNKESLFGKDSKLGLKINKALSNPSENRFQTIHDVCSDISSYPKNEHEFIPIDYKLFHKYIIPIRLKFEQIKSSNMVFNRDIEARLSEIMKVTQKIVDFNNFLEEKNN